MRNLKSLIIMFILVVSGFAFCSAQNIQENIEFIPGEDSGFYYTIQKGDTLWDLSQKFYNSQWDWPGLWQINDEIKNPHWIYPGNRIKIYLKGKAPVKPVYVEVKKMPVKTESVKTEPLKTSFSVSNMDRVGFLKQHRQASLGEVIKEKEDNLIMSENDIIYIKPSGTGTLVPDKIYHIFSATSVNDKIQGKPFKGIKHLIKAKIKILDHKVSYATALITKGYRDVQAGDFVMDYFERPQILEVDDSPDTIDARLICSEDDNVMINDYVIAFIDAGRGQVKPGQIYSIFRKNKLNEQQPWGAKKKDNVKLKKLKSGRLIVLHTEDIASTVMILDSGYAIHPNDMIN